MTSCETTSDIIELYKASYETYHRRLEKRDFSEINAIINDPEQISKLIPALIVGSTSPDTAESNFSAYMLSKIDQIDSDLILQHLYRLFEFEDLYISLLAIGLYEKSSDPATAISHLQKKAEEIGQDRFTNPYENNYRLALRRQILTSTQQIAVNEMARSGNNSFSGAMPGVLRNLLDAAYDTGNPLGLRTHAIENIGKLGKTSPIETVQLLENNEGSVQSLEHLSDTGARRSENNNFDRQEDTQALEAQSIRDSINEILPQIACLYRIDAPIDSKSCHCNNCPETFPQFNHCPQNSPELIARQVTRSAWEVFICRISGGVYC